MINRTAQANKAVAEAWKREQELVRQGKGTKDWTPEQQKDILEYGKAYDEDGKAFQGHHMKSVEKNPEFQSDPANIQFLTRSEHLAAHGGDFHNPTNGFYDPATNTTKEFETDAIEPCQVLDLTEPIIKTMANVSNTNEEAEKPTQEQDTEAQKQPPSTEECDNAQANLGEELCEESGDNAPIASAPPTKSTHPEIKKQSQPIPEKSWAERAMDWVFDKYKKAEMFYHRHKDTIDTVVEVAGPIVVNAAANKLTEKAIDAIDRKGTPPPSIKAAVPQAENHGGELASKGPIADPTELLTELSERTERASPVEHSVSGYTRKQNGKEVHVPSYKRGGKKSGDTA